MAMNENNIEFHLPEGSKGKLMQGALHPLHEAAMRLAGMGIPKPKERTRDLVGMLLCHGARAWRHSQPEAQIHLHVSARSGRAPIYMKLR
ncbi:hypothetical protein [Rhizobium sp. CSW-27]|uniref:hypothetical protein n=1 Tax=Rhizobium sp. CSW-27 TaxID=2839985 RepID=UPI001C0314C6|nr:hypothetical protein [Rhizobium sp. CSW-27]MBT9370141.1 hypothetical protein [Rhizobium sp. CSW-27]